jgi:sodium/potassium/calcium exchanger 6
LRCEDVTQLSPDDDRCDYARANCHVESLLNYPVIYYCHVQPHGPLLAALMAVSMRGSMPGRVCRRLLSGRLLDLCSSALHRGCCWLAAQLTPAPLPPALPTQVLCTALLLLLFRCISRASDDYFSCILSQISQDLGLPPRLGGVTLLALGNGAPDLSACIAAVKTGGWVGRARMGDG